MTGVRKDFRTNLRRSQASFRRYARSGRAGVVARIKVITIILSVAPLSLAGCLGGPSDKAGTPDAVNPDAWLRIALGNEGSKAATAWLNATVPSGGLIGVRHDLAGGEQGGFSLHLTEAGPHWVEIDWQIKEGPFNELPVFRENRSRHDEHFFDPEPCTSGSVVWLNSTFAYRESSFVLLGPLLPGTVGGTASVEGVCLSG